MKIILFATLVTVMLSCNSQKNMIKEDNFKTIESTEPNCPENGVCTFEVIKYKTITIASKFGNTYPEFPISATKSLLKFEYVRNTIPDVEDSSYSEIIYVEIDNDLTSLEIEDTQLINSKVSFGRLCFCRGQTGYYPVKEGQLFIKKTADNSYNFKLSFKVNEVPQVVTVIEESFSL